MPTGEVKITSRSQELDSVDLLALTGSANNEIIGDGQAKQQIEQEIAKIKVESVDSDGTDIEVIVKEEDAWKKNEYGPAQIRIKRKTYYVVSRPKVLGKDKAIQRIVKITEDDGRVVGTKVVTSDLSAELVGYKRQALETEMSDARAAGFTFQLSALNNEVKPKPTKSTLTAEALERRNAQMPESQRSQRKTTADTLLDPREVQTRSESSSPETSSPAAKKRRTRSAKKSIITGDDRGSTMDLDLLNGIETQMTSHNDMSEDVSEDGSEGEAASDEPDPEEESQKTSERTRNKALLVSQK